jgi:2-keto-4-pentenoate hydratase/2-oxohepta-3-ene-1,7-dioic acid hydratase in catechol pathway
LVTRPEKIICVGFNYREHAAETNTPIPSAPPLFNKFNNALNNHGGTVRLPTRVARQFDYETELVIIFGKECRDVAEADALEVVAGYATGNDVSARELQTATSQFLAGKTSDGFAPVGPWLVTRDRVPDPNALRLQTWVNGKVRQDWNTRDMIFNCRKLISYASGVMTIKAGDIMFTGTPQGVILGEKAPREQRQWLKAGDEVVSLVEGLGELRVNLL